MQNNNKNEKKKQYYSLVKEYRERLHEIFPEDKLLIARLFQEMDLKNVNDYDAAVIRKDLIGLAREEELRGSSLSNYMGENENSFCREIAQSAQKRSSREGVIFSVSGETRSFGKRIKYVSQQS